MTTTLHRRLSGALLALTLCFSLAGATSAAASGPAPAPDAAPAAAQASCGAVYVVVRGDTLSSIARRCGTTVAALMSANGLSNSNIWSASA